MHQGYGMTKMAETCQVSKADSYSAPPLQERCISVMAQKSLSVLCCLSSFCLGSEWLQDVIVRMVEFTHQAVDVGRCIPTNVGDKQGNELWRDVVKDGAMDTDLLQDVP